MARKMQKLKPDTVLRNYWRNNERFADFFNAVLFDGKQLIKPEELEDRDTEESSILEHRKYAETIQSSRDNIKIRKRSTVYGVEFVMLGIEHQDHIHYAMPMRIMGMIMVFIRSSMMTIHQNIRQRRGWKQMNICHT